MDESLELFNNIKMGLQCLHQGDFYEAHEYFEDAWRQTAHDSREFYRALLLISGGFFRLEQDRANAAYKFFSHTLDWLDRFPNEYLGFDLESIRNFVENLLKQIDDDTPTESILESSRPIIPDIFFSNPTGTS
jgi:uncharacterized protein